MGLVAHRLLKASTTVVEENDDCRTFLFKASAHGREIDTRGFFTNDDIRELMLSCIELTDGEPNSALMPGQMVDEDSIIFRLLNTPKNDSNMEFVTTALTQACKARPDFRIANKKLT